MEEDRKRSSDNPKRSPFKKFHERIQQKYNKMKLRLDKSKSVGSLTSISDDFDFRNQMYSSEIDIREIDDVHSSNGSENSKQTVKYVVIEENVNLHKNDATLQVINVDEAISEFDFQLTPGPDSNTSDRDTFFDDDFMASCEFINEVSDEKIAEEDPPTPSPKISLRNKISSQKSAAKEKRQRDEKDRSVQKDKKKESRKKGEKLLLSNTTKQDVTKKKQKVATVTIALIEATSPVKEPSSEEKLQMLNCRFRLGSEKRKSKSVKSSSATTTASWQELFTLSMFDEQVLEITLWDKDTFFGRSLVNLLEVQKEKSHRMKLKMVDGPINIELFILLTISGTILSNTFVDLEDYEEVQKKLEAEAKKFAWYKLRDDFTDVGWLSVIVYGARGLSSNECYCVLELGNERLQSLTDYKTNEPNWMKIFTFAVTDVTTILEVTVMDEKKSEAIGKISIPLLKINNDQKIWYALKDNTQRERAKGNNPRILLEMRLSWNLVKAAVRVINLKETKYLQQDAKFDRQLLTRNWHRAKAVLNWILDAFRVTKTCFEWETRKSNVIALTVWLLFCYFFKTWMVPLLLLIPFAWYRREEYFLMHWKQYLVDTNTVEEPEVEKEQKSSTLRQKINSLQEIVQTVQNTIGNIASLGESVKNLFNFTVPFLSLIAIFIIVVISCVMYIIPVNYIFMVWGIHKFTRKILRPNRIPNNEILDLLSRVPDDETLLNCEVLPLQDMSDEQEI